jgi:lipoprotein Spr
LNKTGYILFMMSVTLLASCHSSRTTTKTGKDASVIERVSKDKSSKGGKSDNDTKVAKALVKEANKWLGVPYKYGGTSHSGVDCSGLVMEVFNDAANVKLPRDSRSQQSYCRKIDAKNLQPGDLVFFSSKAGGDNVSHVGMYVGDNSIIHASTSRGVIISDLSENYYKNHYYSSGRVEAITYAATGGKVKETKVEEPQLAYAEPVKTSPAKPEKVKVEKVSTEQAKPEKVEIAATPIVKVNGKITVQPKPRVAAATQQEPEPADTTVSILSGWMD